MKNLNSTSVLFESEQTSHGIFYFFFIFYVVNVKFLFHLCVISRIMDGVFEIQIKFKVKFQSSKKGN